MNASRRIALGVVALALAGALACARNPATGRPEVVLISSATERKLGEEGALEVERAMGLYRAKDLEAYVGALGARLAAASPRQDARYSFRIVDAVEPNAFALPGGPTYVSRGLLALANREDEVACVVAHEVAHVAARHAVARASAQAPFAIAFGLPSAILRKATLGLAGNLIGSVGALASGLVVAPYSREQEREADRLGMEIAARAGWDPRALASVLRTLERDEALRADGEARRPSFFASHPSLPSRVADAEEHAAALPQTRVAPLAASHAAFLERLSGLLVGPDVRQGVFAKTRFLHADLELALDFPAGWKTANTQEVVAAAEPKGEALVSLQLSWIAHAVGARAVEERLALERARAGETLPELVARTRSAWSAEQVAVANGIEAGARLAEGHLVKVVVARSYAAAR